MRIIVAVTGATGVQMSETLLRALRQQEKCEIHLIVSEGAKLTWRLECGENLETLYRLADCVYEEQDLAAVLASGSFVTDGMIVIPCSMKTLAGIVSGYAENLIQRAADVCLKEGRKVVLVPREMPLGKIHLKNLKKAAGLGCAIVPPMLTFYNGAQSLQEQVDHVVGKVLLQFRMEYQRFVPWTGSGEAGRLQNEWSNGISKSTIQKITEKEAGIRRKQTEEISIKQETKENTKEDTEKERTETKKATETAKTAETEKATETEKEENSKNDINDNEIIKSIIIDKKISGGVLRLQAQKIGDDLQILLWGGTTPHLGCVVLASPRPSLRGDGQRSSTSSVINRSGHKDEQVCRIVAEQVAAATGKTVVCSGGIHIDGASKEQIREVQEKVQQATQELIAKL